VRPTPPIVQQDGPDVVVTVRVLPRASRNRLAMPSPDRITLHVMAASVGGAANAACCALLADCLDLPKSRVSILTGESGRQKRVRIRVADAAQVLARLQAR
jgi:hypothetical protein